MNYIMDRAETQGKLDAAYAEWKGDLIARQADVEGFSPPLLLSVTEEYCQAKTRIIFFGKETNDWSWNRDCGKNFRVTRSIGSSRT